ncbi:F0F1 ATP synthase subunit B [Candidatus Nomurabacteria bacterium]|nr:F0F1 ATP synthase subunit B [Candidatus Nomurabacteria bacterium]
MESIISTFHIDWKIIIAQAVNFAVVFVVLYIFALKPLSKLMAERSEKISKGLEDAKSNAIILKDTNLKYEEMLAKARIEANEIFQNGKKEAESKKALMLEDAKNQVASMINDGKKKLEVEKVKMVEEAKNEITSLAIKMTEKLLGDKPTQAYDEKTLRDLKNI